VGPEKLLIFAEMVNTIREYGLYTIKNMVYIRLYIRSLPHPVKQIRCNNKVIAIPNMTIWQLHIKKNKGGGKQTNVSALTLSSEVKKHRNIET